MAVVTAKLSRADLARVFARLLFIQATLHRRGMQNIGVLHALDAVAARVSDDPVALLSRHAEHFNTNPNAAPVVVGGVLRIEEDGDGRGPASVSRFKQVCASALAAAGDVLFSGGLKPLALTLACVSAIYRFFPGLVAVLVLYNAALIAVRYRGVSFGYARGWDVVDAFSGPRLQRLLVLARAGAACAGGILAGVVATRAAQRGAAALGLSIVLAALAWIAMRRGVTASRVALILFPVCWIAALILG